MLRDFATAITTILRCSALGEEPGTDWTVLTSPIEPFLSCECETWVYPSAFHLESLRHHCELILADVAVCREAASVASRSVDITDLLWEAFNETRLDDLRLHASVFCLYGQLIRDRLLNDTESRAIWRAARPCRSNEFHRDSYSAYGEALCSAVEKHSSLPNKDVENAIVDMLNLERETTQAHEQIVAFGQTGACEDLGDTIRAFSNAHQAVLTLYSTLLLADVSARVLLFSLA